MTVKIPAKGGFAVYDQTGCINHSVISGKNEVVLPENGRIVFAGEAGSRFEIVLKKSVFLLLSRNIIPLTEIRAIYNMNFIVYNAIHIIQNNT